MYPAHLHVILRFEDSKKKTLIKILRKKAEANAVFYIPPHLLYSYTRENTRLTLRN